VAIGAWLFLFLPACTWSPPLWFMMVTFAVMVVVAGVDHITGMGMANVVVGQHGC
jgi:hypothetical protein